MSDQSRRTARAAAGALLCVLVLTVLVLALVVEPSSPAPRTVSRHYQVTGGRWSPALNACVRITLDGELSASERGRSGTVTLSDPRLEVVLTRSCTPGSAPAAAAIQAELAQRWWAGDDVRTRRSETSVRRPVARFTQDNGGRAAHWTLHRPPLDCLSYSATVHLSRDSAEDWFVVGGHQSKICVTAIRNSAESA